MTVQQLPTQFVQMTLKPCPWCGKTPALNMYMGDDSWKWDISCSNWNCAFKPTGRNVVIRKSQRFDLQKILPKLELLCSYWNSGCVLPAYEKLNIPLDEWYKWKAKHA